MQNIAEQFTGLVRRLAYFDKRFHVYGVEEPLYSSEIHIICIIAENPGIHASGIAEKMGFTRSAASQMLAKLEKRGMVLKETSPHKLTRLVFRLTDSGRRVHEFHEELHREFHQLFEELLSRRTAQERRSLNRFFLELSREVDDWEKQRLSAPVKKQNNRA